RVFDVLVKTGFMSESDVLLRGIRPEPHLEEPAVRDESMPPEEIARYRRNAIWGILLGIFLPLAGGIITAIGQSSDSGAAAVLGALLNIAGFIFYVWGCYSLVTMKGYHWAYSLIGIFCCVLVLLFLPDKRSGAKASGGLLVLAVCLVALVAVAIIGIVLAVAIPYYVSHTRARCDVAAELDTEAVGLAIEKFKKDLYEQECIGKLTLDPGHFSYIVGNYYGFRGTNTKCQVTINANATDASGNRVVEGWAAKGSHPRGTDSRYIYRIRMSDGARLSKSAQVPAGGSSWGQPDHMCYTESISRGDTADRGRGCMWSIPKAVPCPNVPW
ncbi:MAG: hypothetical protein V2B18_23080, partial [Pseudomonadota bacterium]